MAQKEKAVNRWMKMKSKWAFYPHFVLTCDGKGLYHTVCGRIHTKDMIDLTEREMMNVKRDKWARCRACDYSSRSKV